MATTTPNYGWDVPTSTDYVKDGATAIETLGDDIDATLYTALGGAYPGLRLVKKQTIGSGVSSVTVTGAFSSTYDNYCVIVIGGAGSATTNAALTLGSTSTGYYSAGLYIAYSGSTAITGFNSGNGAAFGNAVAVSTTNLIGRFNLFGPNLAKTTGFACDGIEPLTSGYALTRQGFLNDTTQYTAFTLTPATGTLTGGTIYVYGYGAS